MYLHGNVIVLGRDYFGNLFEAKREMLFACLVVCLFVHYETLYRSTS